MEKCDGLRQEGSVTDETEFISQCPMMDVVNGGEVSRRRRTKQMEHRVEG